MRKFLSVLGLAALLSWIPIAAPKAWVIDSSEADFGFDAAGEVTPSFTMAPFAQFTMFVNGTYSVANLVWLQEEKGSPGSGVFENVLQLSGTGSGLAANGQAEYSWINGPNTNGYRVFMSAAGTGDVLVQVTDRYADAAAFDLNDLTVFTHIDDFNVQTAAMDATFYVATENDTTGTVAVIDDSVQEGAIVQLSGTVGDRADEACLSTITAADLNGLVSDGPIILEVSLQVDTLSGQAGMGLAEIVCPSGSAIEPAEIDSNVVTESTVYNDAVFIMFQSEADDIDGWNAGCVTNSAECNDGGAAGTGFEFVVGTAVAATYQTLRVETDAEGDCYFYFNGNLQYAEDACVLTTARLGFMVWVNTDATAAAVTQQIDYLAFSTTKPSS